MSATTIQGWLAPWIYESIVRPRWTFVLRLTPYFLTTKVYGTYLTLSVASNESFTILHQTSLVARTTKTTPHFLPLRLLWQSITSVLKTILEESAFCVHRNCTGQSFNVLLVTNHPSRLYWPQGLNFPAQIYASIQAVGEKYIHQTIFLFQKIVC